jgi:hypothetical protein
MGGIGLFLGWHVVESKLAAKCYVVIYQDGACYLFGLVYLVYGIFRAVNNRPHKHFDVLGSDVYVYEHQHGQIIQPKQRIRVTPWILFALFVMDQVTLLPLLFYSGSRHSFFEISILLSVFSITTVITMITMVLIGCMVIPYSCRTI